jgi:hypothetical protein
MISINMITMCLLRTSLTRCVPKMPRGVKGATFNPGQQFLLLQYKLAVAPFVKLLPWLLMCVIVHPTGADEKRKSLIAQIVTTLFCGIAKRGTECAPLSWFRQRFGTRTSDPFKMKFVVALTALLKARENGHAIDTHFAVVASLIFSHIRSGLNELLNGNSTLKDSRSLLNGWKPIPKDAKQIEIPGIMSREISIMVVVIMEYLLGYGDAGEPKSTWCAMSRFIQMWTKIMPDEKKCHMRFASCSACT